MGKNIIYLLDFYCQLYQSSIMDKEIENQIFLIFISVFGELGHARQEKLVIFWALCDVYLKSRRRYDFNKI